MNENHPEIAIVRGIPESLRSRTGTLFEQAFSRKTSLAIPDQAGRRALIDKAFCMQHALGAFLSGQLVGVLGLKSRLGSFTEGVNYWSMLRELGVIQGHRAALVFSLFERKPRTDELIIECIAVDHDHRGAGVGSALIETAIELAIAGGFRTLSLEVVDTNPRARTLYEHLGFCETNVSPGVKA